MNTDSSQLTKDEAVRLFRELVRCRSFEEKIIELYPEQEMKCPAHLSIGQEAIAAGVCVALRDKDLIFSNHRCHSHTVAKGVSVPSLMAELYGRVTGCAKGKGGSMHFVDPEVGAMGASAIVGGNLPLAVGTAFAAKLQKQDTITAVFLAKFIFSSKDTRFKKDGT